MSRFGRNLASRGGGGGSDYDTLARQLDALGGVDDDWDGGRSAGGSLGSSKGVKKLFGDIDFRGVSLVSGRRHRADFDNLVPAIVADKKKEKGMGRRRDGSGSAGGSSAGETSSELSSVASDGVAGPQGSATKSAASTAGKKQQEEVRLEKKEGSHFTAPQLRHLICTVFDQERDDAEYARRQTMRRGSLSGPGESSVVSGGGTELRLGTPQRTPRLGSTSPLSGRPRWSTPGRYEPLSPRVTTPRRYNQEPFKSPYSSSRIRTRKPCPAGSGTPNGSIVQTPTAKPPPPPPTGRGATDQRSDRPVVAFGKRVTPTRAISSSPQWGMGSPPGGVQYRTPPIQPHYYHVLNPCESSVVRHYDPLAGKVGATRDPTGKQQATGSDCGEGKGSAQGKPGTGDDGNGISSSRPKKALEEKTVETSGTDRASTAEALKGQELKTEAAGRKEN